MTTLSAAKTRNGSRPVRSAGHRGRAATRRRSAVLTYIGLSATACVAVLPLLFMILSSLKPDQQIFADLGTPKAFLPVGELSLDNYAGVFHRVPAARFIANSLIVTVLIVGLGLVVNSMIGFAISRMRWKGKHLILSLVLATLMVPFETIAVPLVYWAASLPHVSWAGDGFLVKQGMLNTYSVQILPFVANALAIFLFAQHFSDIPKEIDEAARVDGAGWWTIYRRIAVPLSGPTFATVAIITMLPAWNSYLWPLMVIQQESLRPASVGMQYFFQLNPVWGEIMAYGTLITLPVLVVFAAFQRSFVASLAGTAVKG
ncbi:carbohydrate ABC transporter permease [Actinomyces bowdenii]|uniref:carbohydrate ABC transporter permease n=1 Tax=Actinomyces bowdenii TaxID=131109 RepID=UPI00214CAE04|nr:carbohydrate ABC transporter permease [Actinomyces bowdenii]MCR2051920.1 carbohydrate ABC transporter permease [Actinomyces bowdenii]